MNKTNIDLSEIDTVILAGGMGTRLQSVLIDKPKCLAPINGKPFIDILLDNCIDQGLRRFILCVGYLKEQVIEHLSNRNDCEIFFSEENEPLGTGGAIVNAKNFVKSNQFFVMNGDSLCAVNFSHFLSFHIEKYALISLVTVFYENANDSGQLILDDFQNVIRFDEKECKEQGYINAGIYLFDKNVTSLIPADTKYSLEFELFPKLVGKKLFGFITGENFFDIGTPERYKKISKIIKV